MTVEEMLAHVDHTQLKVFATWEDIQKLCREALKYHTASVCIPPSYVKRAHEAFPQLNICTVIGFPNGYNTKEVKVAEAKQAIAEGANEIDMVVNIGDVKDKEFDKVTDEIKALKEVAGSKILKVIVETCYLTEDEKIALCRCVTEGGADFIKTSTGFGTAGAQLEDIELFKKYVGPTVKIKAAGGIRTKEAIEAFLNAGCDRIGCSAAVKALCPQEQ
jgi:deoxyribose-phosphate aldolase